MNKEIKTKHFVNIRGKEPIYIENDRAEALKELLLTNPPAFLDINGSLYKTSEILSVEKDVQVYMV